MITASPSQLYSYCIFTWASRTPLFLVWTFTIILIELSNSLFWSAQRCSNVRWTLWFYCGNISFKFKLSLLRVWNGKYLPNHRQFVHLDKTSQTFVENIPLSTDTTPFCNCRHRMFPEWNHNVVPTKTDCLTVQSEQ